MELPTVRVVEIESGIEMVINVSRFEANPDKYRKVGEKATARKAKAATKQKLKE